MKRLLLVFFLANLLTISATAVNVYADSIPKQWARPSITLYDDTEYDLSEETEHQKGFKISIKYNVDQNLSDFMDMSDVLRQIQYHLSDGDVSGYLQVDWSVDSTDDWKYSSNWDTVTSGQNTDKKCYWEYFDLPLYTRADNGQNIFEFYPYGVNTNDTDAEWWDGEKIGFRDMLGEYCYEEYDDEFDLNYIYLNLAEHTLYVRVRTVTQLEIGGNTYFVSSPWSQISSLGGEQNEFADAPTDTESTTLYYEKPTSLEVPVIGSPTVFQSSGKYMMSVNVTTPEQVSDSNTYFSMITGKSLIRLVIEVNADGSWVKVNLPSSNTTGGVKIFPLTDEMVEKVNNLKIRARYEYQSANKTEAFNSRYSNVISTQKLQSASDKTWSDSSAWAIDELLQAKSNNLIPDVMVGKNFKEEITRGEFAALSVKLYEALTGTTAKPSSRNPFSDTKDPEILKAYALGITYGLGNGTFGVDTLITREQVAKMLAGALSAANPSIAFNTDEKFRFDDHDSISAWANQSVYYMYKYKIINGVGDNKFAPKSNSSREQAVVITSRLLNTYRN